MSMNKGEKIGIVKLSKTFDRHAVRVLDDFLQEDEDREDGKQRQFTLVKNLPTPNEYQQLKRNHYTSTLRDLLADVRMNVEELADELRSWYDNLPESFQDGDKGYALDEAASTLECVNIPDLPDWLDKDLTAVHIPSVDIDSRADRANDSSERLTVVGDRLNELAKTLSEEKREPSESEDKIRKVRSDELIALADECASTADEIMSVEFPGMY